MSKKPKPATAGEKITIRWYGISQMDLATIREEPVQWAGEAKDLARRIDAAIRRAVKKERERCAKIAICTTDPWVNKYKAIKEGATL